MFSTREKSRKPKKSNEFHQSILDNHFLLSEGQSLLIIIGTTKGRAIFVESYPDGIAVIKAFRFDGEIYKPSSRPSMFSSLPDDRASKWETISFSNIIAATTDFEKFQSKQTRYHARAYESSYSDQLNLFLSKLNGYELISDIDSEIDNAYKAAFKELPNYLETDVSSNENSNGGSCILM